MKVRRRGVVAAKRYGCCLKAIEITRGDEVYLKRDSENKYDINAVQVLYCSKKILGYIPRYYSNSVAELLETKEKFCAKYIMLIKVRIAMNASG